MSELLTDEQVRRIARLARLHPDDDQIELYRSQLADVLRHMKQLGELDLDDIEPLSHPIDLVNRLDNDAPQSSLATDAALRNAPQVEGPFIAVPKVLDNSGGG